MKGPLRSTVTPHMLSDTFIQWQFTNNKVYDEIINCLLRCKLAFYLKAPFLHFSLALFRVGLRYNACQEQLLRAQVPKAQKDTDDLTFGICASKNCS